MVKHLRFALAVVAIGFIISLLPALAASVSPGLQTDSNFDTSRIAIKSGSIVLKVNDYNEARAQIMRLADARGAVLHQEKSEANFSGERHGEIILDVDSAQLGPLMERVRRIGKLYSESVQTSDQTSDYQKLNTRISLLKQNEGELIGFMRSPRRMRGSDILFVQYRLYESRLQMQPRSVSILRAGRKRPC
ncbi:MAG: DUF4349 domain-containing protein [Armatimonadota bacterium]